MSQLLQPLDELTGETIRIEAIQEVGPQFDIRRLALQYVIDDGQQRMTQRHDRSLLAPPRRQAVILRRQVCPLGVARRPRGLGQRLPQPAVTLGRPAAAMFARALVVARAHPRPRYQVTRRRELLQVRPDLRDEALGY